MNEQVAKLLWLIGGLVGLGLSSLFSGVETGIYTLNRVRLRLRSEGGDRNAQILRMLLRHNRSLLGTLLLGNNIANYLGASAIAAICTLSRLSPLQTAIMAPLVVAPALVIFGEIVPKSIFQTYADRYTYLFARPLLWARRLFLYSGLLVLVNALTAVLDRVRVAAGTLTTEPERAPRSPANPFHPRQQVRWMISETTHQGTLTPYQSALAERVMNLRNVKLTGAMVPLAKVQAVSHDITRDEFIARLRTHHFSRVPVYRDRPARIVGVVNIHDVLAGEPGRPLNDFILDPVNLSADSSVVRALFALQQARRAMGVVRDKSGAALGIVTIKDLVEEITGEIEAW